MKWYAIFVKTGKEDIVCKYLSQIFSLYTHIKVKLLVPKRELIEYKSGIKRRVYKTLFPGYILVNTESVLSIYNIIRTESVHSDLFSFLRIEGDFQEIYSEEIHLINYLMNEEGIIDTSTIFLERDKVIITGGALIHYKGIIKKINKRKGRAKISLMFLNRNIEIDISIKCLKKINEHDIKNTISFEVAEEEPKELIADNKITI